MAYLARATEPAAEVKYLWPKGFMKYLELFGANQVRDDHKLPPRVIYFVESPFAVTKFWQPGLPAVSPFGWTVSLEQVAIVSELAKGVCFLADRDKRKEAAQGAGLMAERVWVKMPEFEMEDPELLSADQIPQPGLRRKSLASS